MEIDLGKFRVSGLNKNTPIGIWLILILIAIIWLFESLAFVLSFLSLGILSIFLIFPLVYLFFVVLGYFTIINYIKLNSTGWKLSITWFSLWLIKGIIAFLATLQFVTAPSQLMGLLAGPAISLVALIYIFSKQATFEGKIEKKTRPAESIFTSLEKIRVQILFGLLLAIFLAVFGPVNFIPNLISLFIYHQEFSLSGYYLIAFLAWLIIAGLVVIYRHFNILVLRGTIALVLLITVVWPMGVLLLFRNPLGLALITSARFYHPEFNIPVMTPPADFSEEGWGLRWHDYAGGARYEIKASYNSISINHYGSQSEPTEQEFKQYFKSLIKDPEIKEFIEEYTIRVDGSGHYLLEDNSLSKEVDGKKVILKIDYSCEEFGGDESYPKKLRQCKKIGQPFEGAISIG